MNNYFNGFGTQCVTVPCEESVKEGAPVSFDGSGMAYLSDDGTEFLGVCTQVRGGYATVALRGYVEFDYVGQQPMIGFVKLICVEGGKVKVDSEFGRSVLVVSVDYENKKLGMIL